MNLVLAGDIFETPGAYIFLISIDSQYRFILDLIHLLPLSDFSYTVYGFIIRKLYAKAFIGTIS